jgi:glutamine---fructose-6-phosphate transaminase (isomerizing)
VVIGGGGPNWPAALEGALKIREASYVPATGFEMEEILHGPWASFDEHTAMILIAPPGSPARQRALDILPVMRQIGVTTIAVGSSDDQELAQAANATLELPASAEIISVVPATAILQQFSYWLAMRQGGNPDRIRRDQSLYGSARAMYTR